jgi:subtilisin-like proprotein convertase family protein
MAFFSFWKRSNRNSRDSRKGKRAVASRSVRGLWVEALEDRTVPATIAPTLPAAVVTNPNYVSTLAGSSPTLVQDPINPQKLVEVNTTGSQVQAVYSTDGGATWHNLLNPTGSPANLLNVVDPAANANPAGTNRYAVVNAPAAAIDLNQTLYITYTETDAAGLGGALVLQRFSFAGGSPSAVAGGTNQVLNQWFGADPVLNPTIGVDNNVTSFTDSTATTDNVQTDSMVGKAVYIAWSTANTAPTVVPVNFNPNVIKAIASADGGKTFTTPQFVNNGSNIAALGSHYTSPKIVFTQGSADGRVAGGQLVFVWADFGRNTIDIDASKPDGGNAAKVVAGVVTTTGSTGAFGDAVPAPPPATVPPTPDTPTLTTFTANVSVTDPAFILADLDVSLSILAPHVNQLSVDLVAPDGTTVHLLQNQTNSSALSTVGRGVIDAPNLGELNGFLIGTDFDDGAARAINDLGATAPYTSDYRPEVGSLSVFNGKTAAQLTGTWNLVVTDFLSDGMTVPTQRVDAWALHMSSYISNTGFGADESAINFVKTAPGSAQAPFPTVTPLSGPQGIGQGLSVAIDNTLGAFSPYEGRLYVAYNVAGGVKVATFDDLTPTSVFENFTVTPSDNTNGSRFNPTIAVDLTTGTVGVMYYDSNWDNFQVRSAQSFTDSVDGGEDWSPSAQFNQLKTATDAITGQTIVIEPYAGNEGLAGTLGFGDQSGLVMSAGHVIPMFASNNNLANSLIATATVTIAAGPRILQGDMGSVIADAVDSDDDPNIVTYNDQFASDGTREITGIRIVFDRPIDVSTFDATQFKLVYRDTVTPTSQPGTIIPNTTYTVVPIDNDDEFGLLPPSTIGRLAEEFLITFLPGDALNKVGTYSYAVGNVDGSTAEIRDMVKTVSGAAKSIVAAPDTIAVSPTGATETGTTVTITTTGVHNLVVGQSVKIAGVGVAGYNGTFTITGTPTPNTFTYTAAAGLASSGGGNVTAIVPAVAETTETSTIAASPTGATEVGNLVTIQTTAPHGLAVGVTVTIAGVGVGYNGTYVITSVPSPTTFTYVSTTLMLAPTGGGTVTANIVIVTMSAAHGLTVGQTVAVGGVGVAGYNGIFTVLSVPTSTTFTYSVVPGSLLPSGGGVVHLATIGNFMDENQNAVTGETSSNTTLGDVFAIPTPTAGGPFVLPYDASTLPLIIPGPYIVSTSVVGQPVSQDNLVLNGTNDSIDVTFDRDMNPTSLTNTNILRMVGPAGTIPFYTNNTPAAIPDGSGSLTSTITVTDSLAINDLAVGINITHANVAELSVTLVAPDGTTINLYAGTGAGANLTNTIFDSFSTTPITVIPGGSPYTAVFRPAGGSLSVLNGKNYLGTWQLIVTDKKPGNAGTLNSWSLNPYTVTPNPLGGVKNRTFRITFGGQSLSGTYTIVMGPNSAGQYGTDTNGNQIDINHNAGLDLLRGGDPDNGTALLNTYTTGTLSTPIPAGSTVNIPINVTDSFLVQNVTLSLTIQHKSDPDLTATLIAPDGFSVEIFTAVGKSTDANFTNTVLSDAAINAPIESAIAKGAFGITGTYAPLNPLSDFKNHGSLGTWVLRIQSSSSTIVGKFVNWSLNLTSSVPGSGLGEPIADQAQVSFRIFTQDPTNPISDQSWTAVGPASIDSGARSGNVNAIAVDPSDPSGNTVYVGGSEGGVWKTSNFYTTDPQGPTWVPLTDFGPNGAINIASIAIFARNGDPNQSIIYALTGTETDKTDTLSPAVGNTGVGLIRSEDGGKTWHVLDSSDNLLAPAARDHIFVGTTGFKVIVDPTAEANGDVIVYMAVSGINGGIYRSLDSGDTWTLLQGGNATDVTLGAGSADVTGNLQVLYGAIEGAATFVGGGTGAPSVGGVYFSPNAPTAASMSILNGGNGDNERIFPPSSPIAVLNDALNPNNNMNGRIALATPVKTGNPLQDTLYQGWIYAAVATGPGKGLYMSKDYGLNWTLIPVPTGTPPFTYANDGYMTLQVDPNNPSVVYYGGINDTYFRVDVTKLADPYAFVYYDQGNLPGPLTAPAGVSIGLPPKTFTSYFNFEIDPINRFQTPASYKITAPTSFTNNGTGAVITQIDGGGLDDVGQLSFVAMDDPLSGQTRFLFGNIAGIFTGTADSNGNTITNIGFDNEILGSRNGNLQISLFNDGTAQPGTLAAELSGALFYGNTDLIGFPQSDPNILTDGNLNWTRPTEPTPPNAPNTIPEGPGYGIAVDPTGSGTTYTYMDPAVAYPFPADFFAVSVPGNNQVSRTTGLLQSGDVPTGNILTNVGQWPTNTGFEFAVNPVDPSAILLSSSTGRVFLTSGPTNGFGKRWFAVANPTDLDSTHADALAFGAPAPNSNTLDTFLYAGTQGGKVFVSFTGGGVGVPWKNISAGLDGSAVEQIIPDPTRGSHALYAITTKGVFFMADSSIAAPTWVNITGNLLVGSPSRILFNDPNQTAATDQVLTSIQVDWRYAIPDVLSNPTGPSHPVLYVGTDGGVYRSLDKGITWTYFPDQGTDGAREDAGYLPTVPISALTLTTGDVNPTDGSIVNQANGLNMLVATTAGRGTFAIRINDAILLPNGQPLSAYAVDPVSGPHVTALEQSAAGITEYASTATATSEFTTTDWSAMQATGAPDTLLYGDISTAWSPLPRNSPTPEVLTVNYATALFATGVTVRETNGNGFVTEIDAIDTNGVSHVVWTGTDPSLPGNPVDFNVTFAQTSYLVQSLNIVVNPNHDLSTWEEIDSVQLQGNAGALPGFRVTFSGPVDPTTFTPADINSVTDPNGNPMTVQSVVDVNAGDPNDPFNVYDILFTTPPTAPGFYTVDFGPRISDFAGNLMNQNQDLTNGQPGDSPIGDAFVGRVLLQPFANHAPVLVATTATVPAVAPGTPAASIAGISVFDFIQSLTPTPGITDADDQPGGGWFPDVAPLGIAVTGVDNTNGTWEYSLDGTSWTPFVADSDTSARLLQGSVHGTATPERIRFVPNAGFTGTATFTFRAWDLTSDLDPVTGADGDTGDASINGGATAYSSTFATGSLLVGTVNQAPTFVAGPTKTVLEDSGPATFAGWATSISPGAPSEASQTLNFVVTGNTNPSLFSIAPAISANGTLTFTPAADANGSAPRRSRRE